MNRDPSIIWPDGLKRTKAREAVMHVLETQTLPVTAQYLYEKLQAGDESLWISTVYRALESFVEKNFVLKSIPTDSTIAVYSLNRHKHTHYAVCVGCHSLQPIDNCPFEHAHPPLTNADFHMVGHNLEIYGYCEKCFRKVKN
jgi:Fur family ferric uptake transcriptional regulator